MYFNHIINGIRSWIDVYQSIEAFEPLVKEILRKHNLKYDGMENLIPGSNVVFKLKDDMVIKIFSPGESGLSGGKLFYVEEPALKHAKSVGIPCPEVLFSGTFMDRYLFPYIIMDYIEGLSFIEKRKNYTSIQKKKFAEEIKKITKAMNIPILDDYIPVLTKEDCMENYRWNDAQKCFCEDRKKIISEMSFSDLVYVHGDFKAANVIISDDEKIHIIDFADSHIAPIGYEMPYIVFGLFGCDEEMMKAYFGDYQNDEFYKKLTNNLLIHKFGIGIMYQICELDDDLFDSIMSVGDLNELIAKCLQGGDILID
ncbi:MAG: phosphotransferase [Oscillospiraceae bacterium]|nr:phosphotransferase [Oscillospiraceae bacterium]